MFMIGMVCEDDPSSHTMKLLFPNGLGWGLRGQVH